MGTASTNTVHSDFVLVMNEIGNIQKALNVEFAMISSIGEEVRTAGRESVEIVRRCSPEISPTHARHSSAALSPSLSKVMRGRRRDFFCQTDALEVHDASSQ